ncbi:MAG TPA: hypothetical protein VM284_03640 [Candidatus Limnocylindria bacterium]|nr:hypothetical protein [Candidatus Limnocylindria bacterium]
MAELPARLGVAHERCYGFLRELGEAVMAVAREQGSAARDIDSAEDEAEVDLVLAIGSVHLYPDLVARPHSARRVLWHTEPLPRMSTSTRSGIHRWLPTGRMLDLSRAARPALERNATWRRWREKAANVREPLTNVAQLKQHIAAFDRIVIDAQSRAVGAVEAGIAVDVVPFGYHPAYAGPIGSAAPRDVDVVALANVSTIARRHRILAAVEEDLGGSNVRVARVSGHVYGADRRRALERARVSIDVHRIPGGYPLYNFILASAAGVAMVTEPLFKPEPLVAGVHYVEAAETDLAAAVRALLADEPRRLRIVDAAQELLRTDLDLRRTLPLALG